MMSTRALLASFGLALLLGAPLVREAPAPPLPRATSLSAWLPPSTLLYERLARARETPAESGAEEAVVGWRDLSGGPDLAPEPADVQVQVRRRTHRPLSPSDAEKAVSRVLRERAGQVRYVFLERQRENPGLRGRVELEIAVRRGSVADVRVRSDSTRDPRVARSLAEKVRRWQFPPGVSGTFVRPFVFR